MRSRILFVGLSVVLLGLVGWAAFKDSSSRTYINIQTQYLKDYPSSDFNVQVQQLFPSFPQATIEGDTYRVERCISCHVPDIGTIGPVEAAKRLSEDFFKYEPNAQQLAAEYHLSGIHPAYITPTGGNYPPSLSFAEYGPTNFTPETFTPYTPPGAAPAAKVTVQQPGPLPAFLDPSTNYGASTFPVTGPLGIDQVGCIVCHNGNRLGLDESDAHQNLIINPVYTFTEGAQLYYLNCARCHGGQGEGGAGPPAQQPGPSRLLQRGLLLPLHRVRLHRLRALRQHHAQLGRHRQRLERHAEPTRPWRDPQHITCPHPDADQHPHPVHPPLGGVQHPPMRAAQ